MEAKDLLALLGPLLGLWVGHRLTIGQKEVDRLWELRRATYGAILSDLQRLIDLGDDIDFEVNQIGWDEAQTNAGLRITAFHTRYRDVMRRFTDDYLIVSRGFRVQFEHMQRDPEGRPEDDGVDIYARALSRVKDARPKLLTIALHEIETMSMGWFALGLRRLRTGERPTPASGA